MCKMSWINTFWVWDLSLGHVISAHCTRRKCDNKDQFYFNDSFISEVGQMSVNQERLVQLHPMHPQMSLKNYCYICEVLCSSRIQLDKHCGRAQHQYNLKVDSTDQWQWRKPPTGVHNFQICAEYVNYISI